jgi:hypothetical protein
MQPADGDGDAAPAQRASKIERARELIGLHADQHHHAGAGLLDHPRQTIGTDAGIGLIKGMDIDLDVIAEHAPRGAVLREPIESRQRVRRNGGAKPLDGVSVVVVMRRLDQQQREGSGHGSGLNYMWVNKYSIAQPLSTAGCGASRRICRVGKTCPRLQPGIVRDGEKV